MPHRYIALVAPPAAPDALQRLVWARAALSRQPGWRAAFARPGLEVWTNAAHRTPVVELEPGGAVIIGDLLAGTGNFRGPLPTEPVAAAARLCADGWGSYVALLPHAAGAAVLRAPAGPLDALVWRQGALTVVSDDVRRLPPGLAPPTLSLDWDVITDLVKWTVLAGRRAPFGGLTEVPSGALEVDGRVVEVWRPARFARTPAALDAKELRRITVAVAGRLAALEPTFAVEVSGGLDSAIVAAALAEAGEAPRAAAAFNHFPARPEGDERHYAAQVCAATGLALETFPRPIGDLSLTDLSELADLAGPALIAADAPADRDVADRASALGVGAILGGQGGDAVFFQMPSAAVVADRLRVRGLAALGEPFVQDCAQWMRRSVWSLAGEARRRKTWTANPSPMWTRFWGGRAHASGRRPPHPWLRDVEDLLPSKQLQVQSLAAMQHPWNRTRRGAVVRTVEPLLAQPIVEACLATPSWRLLDGRRDRALARDAFAELLPPEVIERRSKGALTTLYTRRVARSLDVLRPYLLDGVLVDAGVLDRAAMAAALDPDELIWRGEGALLGRIALIEAWVRHWQTQVPDLARSARS
ncbi:MAG: hypothetical protein DI570_08860 [Phenylobacterium zucineum]|nr:MAG: hypothetical protein DI570_08860 [Phenylobacterium zucineum]